LSQQVKLSMVLSRPHITIEDIIKMSPDAKQKADDLNLIDSSIVQQAEIQLKYEGYINREQDLANKMNKMDSHRIPEAIDYMSIPSISMEARQKMTKLRPATIGQASRISGVSPSDIAVLLIHLGK